MKVYVITRGDYSSYEICAVTLNKDQAKQLQKLFTDKYDDAMIEEYDTDTYKPIYEGKTAYDVYFFKDGTKKICESSKRNMMGGFRVHDYRKTKSRWYKDVDYEIQCLYAEDVEHALKIACDMMAELKYRKAMKEE